MQIDNLKQQPLQEKESANRLSSRLNSKEDLIDEKDGTETQNSSASIAEVVFDKGAMIEHMFTDEMLNDLYEKNKDMLIGDFFRLMGDTAIKILDEKMVLQ